MIAAENQDQEQAQEQATATAQAVELPEDINSMELQQEQAINPEADINEIVLPPTIDLADNSAIYYPIRVKLAENKKDDEADKVVGKMGTQLYHRPEKGMYFTRGKKALVEFQALVAQGQSEDQARAQVVAQLNDRGGRQYPLIGFVAVQMQIDPQTEDWGGTFVGRDWLNTMIDTKRGTTTLADLLHKSGHTLPKGLSLADQGDYANHYFGTHQGADGEEEEGVVAWARLTRKAYCTAEEMEIKVLANEKNWPLETYEVDGQQYERKAARIECPNCGTEIRGQVVVSQFVPQPQ